MIKRASAQAFLLIPLCLLLTASAQAQDESRSRVKEYYSYYSLPSLVKGGSIDANWMPDGNSFWYAEGAPADTVIYKVDPMAEEAAAVPLFDTDRVRKALEPLLGHDPPYNGLPFDTFSFEDEGKRVKFEVEEREFFLDMESYAITPAPAVSEEEKERTTPQRIRKGFTSGAPDVMEVRSPDKMWFAGSEDDNIYLRSCIDNHKVFLTADAAEDYGWSVSGAAWSPDSLLLALNKSDARGVHKIPEVHWLKTEEQVEFWSFTKAGGKLARTEIHIVDTISKKQVKVEGTGLDDHYFYILGWRQNGSELLLLRMDREFKRLDLLAADTHTGKARFIITEKSETFIYGLRFLQIVRTLLTPIGDGKRFVWMAERDGWNHLYLYDFDGFQLARLTRGEKPVEAVVAVDQESEWVYFLAHGRDDDPYDTHLYRVDFEGKNRSRLTEAPGQHNPVFSPSKKFFLDTHSTAARPPRVELKKADGELIRVVSEADISGLKSINWSPPETFTVKAADGKTDLHGVLYKPADFDPGRRYPVLDHIYNGPFVTWVPRTFIDFTGLQCGALARLGFIVFVVDGRGTIWRGKEFQDVVYHNFGRNEIPDHAAVLKNLAADRPYMDLDRVGIFGSSWGGYMTIRAMVTHPHVYHAGAAACPVSDLYDHAAFPIEGYMGTPQNNREGYEHASSIKLADRLEGKLLLMHGTSDMNATFSATMKMVSALIKAGKEHELVVVPEVNHAFSGVVPAARYISEIQRKFFERHLRPELEIAVKE